MVFPKDTKFNSGSEGTHDSILLTMLFSTGSRTPARLFSGQSSGFSLSEARTQSQTSSGKALPRYVRPFVPASPIFVARPLELSVGKIGWIASTGPKPIANSRSHPDRTSPAPRPLPSACSEVNSRWVVLSMIHSCFGCNSCKKCAVKIAGPFQRYTGLPICILSLTTSPPPINITFHGPNGDVQNHQ